MYRYSGHPFSVHCSRPSSRRTFPTLALLTPVTCNPSVTNAGGQVTAHCPLQFDFGPAPDSSLSNRYIVNFWPPTPRVPIVAVFFARNLFVSPPALPAASASAPDSFAAPSAFSTPSAFSAPSAPSAFAAPSAPSAPSTPSAPS